MWNQAGRPGRELSSALPGGGGEPRVGVLQEESGGEQRRSYPARGKLPLVKDLVGKRTQRTAGSKSLQRAGSVNVSHQRAPKTG